MSTSFFFQPNGPDYGMGSVNPAYDQHQAHRSAPGPANQQGQMAFSEPTQNINGFIHDRIQRLETQQAVDKALAEQSSRRLEEKLDKLMSFMQDRPLPTQAAAASAPPARATKELVIAKASPPLDKADYSDVIRFWDEETWDTYRKSRSVCKTAFLQGDDGTYTSGTRLKHINTVAKQLWAELYAHRQDPPTWGQAIDTAALYFTRAMTARFVEFQLCNGSWKAQAFATATFPDWTRGARASGNLRRNDPSVVSHVVYETSSRGHESKPASSELHKRRDKDRKRLKSSRRDREDEPRKKRRLESHDDKEERRKGKEKVVVEDVDALDEGKAPTPVRSPAPETPKTPARQLSSSPRRSPPSLRASSFEPLTPPPAAPAGLGSLTPPPASPAGSERSPTADPEPEVDQLPKSKNIAPRKSGRTGLNHLSKVNVPKTSIVIQAPPPPPPAAGSVAGSSTVLPAKAPSKKDLMVANDSNSVQNLYAKFLLETNPLLTKAEFRAAWANLPEKDPKKYAELESLAKVKRAAAKASKKKLTD